jgi:hypothetical protein
LFQKNDLVSLDPAPHRKDDPPDYGIIERIDEETQEIWVRWLSDWTLLWVNDDDINLIARPP